MALNGRRALSHCSRSTKSRCPQGWILLQALKDNPLQASLQLPGGFLQSRVFLRLRDSTLTLPPSSCSRIFPCVSVSSHDLGIKTPVIGIRAILTQCGLILTNTSTKIQFQIKSHSQVPELKHQHTFLRRHNSTHRTIYIHSGSLWLSRLDCRTNDLLFNLSDRARP